MNGQFADIACSYLSGVTGMASAFATAVSGSPDLFAARWDANLPGCLAAGCAYSSPWWHLVWRYDLIRSVSLPCRLKFRLILISGRRPAFGINAFAPMVGSTTLLELASNACHVPAGTGSASPLYGTRVLPAAKALLVMQLLSQVRPRQETIMPMLGMAAACKQSRPFRSTSPVVKLGFNNAHHTLTFALAVSIPFGSWLQGVPTVSLSPADEADLRPFISKLMHLRHRYVDLLCPPEFDTPRSVQWHGAAAGSTPDWAGASQGEHGSKVTPCCSGRLQTIPCLASFGHKIGMRQGKSVFCDMD